MKTADEIRSFMLSIKQERNDAEWRAVKEYCEQDLMKRIENEAEMGNTDFTIDFPCSISAEKCMKYLNNNGYVCKAERPGRRSSAYVIGW